jgi:phosphomannomutase
MTAPDNTLMISISGIRGIAGKSLTPEVVTRFAQAFGTWLPPGSAVVVGNDTRISRDMMRQALFAGLRATGCRILDVGICPTPTIKLMVCERGAAGGICITASHNPIEWNGLKMVRSDGVFLNAAQGEEVLRLYHDGPLRNQPSPSPIETDDRVLDLHLDRILRIIDTSAIARRRPKVVIDACHGVASVAGPRLLERLGCEVVPIGCIPDGKFPHNPEPLPQNLTDLCDAVRREGADLGLAIDPDADRVAFVTEAGVPPGEDYTLAIAVDHVLRARPGVVVSTLSTSQIVADAAARYHCPFIVTKVGEVHVVEEMLLQRSIVGGEGNGGVIVPEIDPGRDALVGATLLLAALAGRRLPVSALVAEHPRYAVEKRKVAIPQDRMQNAVQTVRRAYQGRPIDPVEDGVKLYLGAFRACPWVHVRASNTEPVLRVIAEAATEQEVRSICDAMERIVAGG